MNTSSTKLSAPALWTATVAAVGASICCVVPLVLVLLGVSGAWIANLTALDAWRPWFSAITLICLAIAFWNLYGPSSRCRREGACFDPRVLSTRRRWLWLATQVIGLLLLFPYYIPWLL